MIRITVKRVDSYYIAFSDGLTCRVEDESFSEAKKKATGKRVDGFYLVEGLNVNKEKSKILSEAHWLDHRLIQQECEPL